MRYSRVLAVVTLMAALGLAAVALARSSSAPSPSQLRRIVQQEVKQLSDRIWAVQRSRNGAHAPSINVPAPQLGAVTCYVGTQCSIRPCVVPVANAVGTAIPAASDAVATVAVQRALPAPALQNAVPAPTFSVPRTGCPLGDRVPKTIQVSAPTVSASPR